MPSSKVNIKPIGAPSGYIGFILTDSSDKEHLFDLSNIFPIAYASGNDVVLNKHYLIEQGSNAFISLPAILEIPEDRLKQALDTETGVYDSATSEKALKFIINATIKYITSPTKKSNLFKLKEVLVRKLQSLKKPNITMESSIDFLVTLAAIAGGNPLKVTPYNNIKLPSNLTSGNPDQILNTILLHTIINRENRHNSATPDLVWLVTCVQEGANIIDFLNSNNKPISSHVMPCISQAEERYFAPQYPQKTVLIKQPHVDTAARECAEELKADGYKLREFCDIAALCKYISTELSQTKKNDFVSRINNILHTNITEGAIPHAKKTILDKIQNPEGFLDALETEGLDLTKFYDYCLKSFMQRVGKSA